MNSTWSPQRNPLPILLAFALALAWLAGCAGYRPPYPAGTYQRAAALREHGQYQLAVDAYSDFLQRHPADSLADRAELEKALTLMHLKEYPLAAVELQILRKEYPTSPLLPEALYQEGRAYLLQVGRVERDISPVFEARRRFRQLLDLYPTHPRAEAARQALVDISDLVVRKKMGQADLYRRLHRDNAAAVVLDRLLESETETRLRDRVLWERAQTALALADTATAAQRLDQLLADFPDSPLHDTAADLRRRLGASPAS